MMTARSDAFLVGKTAIITGSGRGIGRAIAIELAQRGAQVAVNFFRRRESAEETAAVITAAGGRALVVKANVGQL
ncbi:MAG: SDR family NAD(P)-dependent oxidoreductase, partial [Anaerolineae bacterium]